MNEHPYITIQTVNNNRIVKFFLRHSKNFASLSKLFSYFQVHRGHNLKN